MWSAFACAARRSCRNTRVSCVHGRGSSRRRVLPHMIQSETTFKVFSVFHADPNSCSRVLRGKEILNLPELRVDGAISEPRGCLRVPPYLTGMATGGHGGFLNPNWIPRPHFLSLLSVRRSAHSTTLNRPESRWFLSGLGFNDVRAVTQDGLTFLFCSSCRNYIHTQRERKGGRDEVLGECW